jgi:hypothetical protein
VFPRNEYKPSKYVRKAP